MEVLLRQSTSVWKRSWRNVPLSVWTTLASLAIHAIVIAIFWHLASRSLSGNHRLHVTLRSPHNANIVWAASAARQRDAATKTARQPEETESTDYPTPNKQENSVTAQEQDEVYLPQELLTTAAEPEERIDLQGESPPGPGLFRMTLWINKDGLVTQANLEDSETPAWFTDRIVETFKNSRFHPGMREDKPIASTLIIEVTF